MTDSAPQLHFLGWDRPFLASVAAWLQDHFGGDLSGVLVALPGGRATRRLQDRLAELLPGAALPPEVLTAGVLSDRLLRLERPAAGRLPRTLAWAQALRAMPPTALAPLFPHPPGAGDAEAWLALGGRLRSLHGELAAEGLGFAAVRDRLDGAGGAAEQARWEALAAVQERYRAALGEAGLADPHEARLEAAAAGRVAPPRAVVLAGVTDRSVLLLRCLEAAGAPVHALVFAPRQHAGWFDAWGFARAEPWQDPRARLPLAQSCWKVVGPPREQAEAAVRAVHAWGSRFAPEDISLGLGQDELAPALAQAFGSRGVPCRHAAGRPLARTRPARLLQAAAAFLEDDRFASFAALARHPDLGPRLVHHGRDGSLIEDLDRYAEEHLPAHVRLPLPGTGEREDTVRAALDTLRDQLGSLTGPPRPLPEWSGPVAEWLDVLYGEQRFLPDEEEARGTAAALERLGQLLQAWRELPPSLALQHPLSAAAALRLLVRELESAAVPPPPDDAALEMLGWLELAHDDAPALVLTGFQEGAVPQAPPRDPFLSAPLRQQLGLPGDAERLARDAVALSAILASREEVCLVSGRRSVDGEPLLPSRLAFLCEDEELPARVADAFRELDGAAPSAEDELAAAVELPRRDAPVVLDEIPVTAFRAWLDSPYLYYLERLLRLRSRDDSALELDPLQFGVLAHGVLEAFGRGEQRHAPDEGAVRRELDRLLDRDVAERFGDAPLPAVRLQVEQLRHRLHRFAAWQADQVRQGWRIAKVEHPFSRADVLEPADGPVTLVGKVDRIDRHVNGRWRLLDYKTGDAVPDPEKAHRKKDAWTDLQLPLYAWLAAGELEPELAPEQIQLGYVALSGDPAAEVLALAPWNGQLLDEARDRAGAVVDEIRAGGFFVPPAQAPRDPLFAAICDRGLGGDDPEEEAEA